MNAANQVTKTISYKNTPFHYHMFPNEGKDTILLLHSAFSDHRLFEKQVAGFRNDYQLILLDMPGHGAHYSSRSPIDMGDLPDIVKQVLDENQIPSCHLVGVSLGSLAAQAFADRHPERAKSVTAVGGYSIHKANGQVLKEQGKLRMKWMLLALVSIHIFRSFITSNCCRTEQGRELIAQGVRHFHRSSFRGLAGVGTFFRPKMSPVPYPLLIVVGEHDLPYVSAAGRQWNKLEPNSRFVTLAGAGHCANADAPEEFNTIVRQFIS